MVSTEQQHVLVLAMTYGKALDVSDPTTVSQFTCMKNQGFNVAIVRAYRNANGGIVDSNALTTMQNAKTGKSFVRCLLLVRFSFEENFVSFRQKVVSIDFIH